MMERVDREDGTGEGKGSATSCEKVSFLERASREGREKAAVGV